MSKKNRAKPQEVDAAQLAGVLARAQATMTAEDYAVLKAVSETVVFLQQELKNRGTTIERLRRILFGASTESTDRVVGKTRQADKAAQEPSDAEKKKGHGRRAAAAYHGAEKVKVPHSTLTAGTPCEGCLKGKVYPLEEPKKLVRITGMAPLSATVYECERLRCNLCGEVSAAPSPEGVGDEKYDETAVGMTALLKYGTGLPFNRIEKLQEGLGIPLPAATQWELVEGGARKLEPVFDELVNQAAQAEVLHNDDTTMKVLALTKEQVQAAAAGEPLDRTGVFTSGIIARSGAQSIALFFTGRQHAGENLGDVLKHRAAQLAAPVQMCDALSANASGEFKAILANCLSHARRGFVDVAADFPAECKHVLEALREVYRVDAAARNDALSPAERLSLHQLESGPVMAGLETWLEQQFNERKVEPNSGLGQAITYMHKHWRKLTLFLREEGAPLDNNICERALKKVILHRKNALFYRTLNGAHVGDVFMSLIHTTELCEGNPFDYLVSLLRNHDAVADAPDAWMPWNYKQAVASMTR